MPTAAGAEAVVGAATADGLAAGRDDDAGAAGAVNASLATSLPAKKE